ncbi:MAG: substrate-binding domain-containing protein, partial [Clostridium sp.]
FYYEVLNKLVNIINSKGLHTMIFTCEPLGNINDVIDSMVSYQVDGVIITSSAISHQVNCEINDFSMPIVLLNGYVSGLDISAVHSDNYGACIMMADYLVETGHKSFAYISTDKSKYLNYLPRQEAFLYGLSRHGINDCKICPASYSYESGVEAASHLITEKGYPDAIFCACDKPALGAIDFAKDFGLKVGSDISITGFYAPVGVDLPAYSLTCLKQDIQGLADDAVNLLIAKIEDPSINSKIITRPMKLEIGSSSR